jgi:predicted ester cyclase
MPDGTEVPPTGKQFEVVGMEIAVAEDGAITQHDMVWDNMTLLAQLGITG